MFENVSEKPVPSILRNFSAPVVLEFEEQTEDDLLFLFANDSDEVNRYPTIAVIIFEGCV